MRILIADDEPVSRQLLQSTLARWGYEVVVVGDGKSALQALVEEVGPALAILDWNMPGLDGAEVCRRVRANAGSRIAYLILLTGRGSREDLVAGLESGADDYILKPFDPEELHARLRAGLRIVELQSNLSDRVHELEAALEQVSQLQGLLPICMYCKCIRDDKNYWQQVEHYISRRSEVLFSHGICPSCYSAYVEPELDRMTSSAKSPAST